MKDRQAVKYVQALELDCEDDGDRHLKLLRKQNYSQSVIRQICCELGDVEKVNMVFWQYGYERVFNKDFIVEMFGHADKSTRDYIDRTLAGSLGDFKCDLDLDTTSSVFKKLEEMFKMWTYLQNVYNYIKYCNCTSYYTIERYNSWGRDLRKMLSGLVKDAEEIKEV